MQYNTYDYGRMLADSRRIEAYCAAIKSSVTPNSVVLDVGSGIGLFALEAARAGAAKVIAVDPNPVVLQLKQLAKANNCKIEIHAKRSQELELEDKADIVVFDLRGALPLYAESLATLIDVRNRLAKPNAVLLPNQEDIYLSLVSCPELYAEKKEPWGSTKYSVDLSPLQENCLQNWYREPLEPNYIIGDSKLWHSIDYRSVETVEVNKTVSFVVPEEALLHGFFLHTEVKFPTGHSYACNSPGDICVSGSAFFPFLKPQQAKANDKIEVNLSAHPVASNYLWSWNTKISRDDEIIYTSEQNTLGQLSISAKELHKRSASFTPSLNTNGKMSQRTLELFDAKKEIAEIAEILCTEFPNDCRTLDTAVAFIGKLSARYSN